MFENPRRGRQARNVKTNVPKILHLKSLGAPDLIEIEFDCSLLPAWGWIIAAPKC